MFSLCFNLHNGHVILALKVNLCMVFKNMFVNLFDFQNQFLFVFLGYVYVSGSYFLLFVFFKVCLCRGGLLSLFVYFLKVCLCL